MRQFNFVYSQLVTQEKDFLGMVAYAIYKNQKIEWVKDFRARNNNQDPSDAELDIFHNFANMPSQIKQYKDQALALIEEFNWQALENEIEQYRKDILQSAVIKAVTPGWIKRIFEYGISSFVSSIITLALAFFIWLAAKGPEKLIAEATAEIKAKYVQIQPESVADKEAPSATSQ